MKWPLVFRSSHDWVYEQWKASVENLETTLRDLTALRIADAETISSLQAENANLWKILNRNANKPKWKSQPRKNGKWVKKDSTPSEGLKLE